MSKRRKCHQQIVYKIAVQGQLDAAWSDWFSNMTVASDNDAGGAPITILTGPIADQAALRGILCKLWDLNLTLISVVQIKTE